MQGSAGASAPAWPRSRTLTRAQSIARRRLVAFAEPPPRIDPIGDAEKPIAQAFEVASLQRRRELAFDLLDELEDRGEQSDRGARALGRRFFEEQDRLRGGPAEALCAADYRAEIGGNPAMDFAGHEGFARVFYDAFDGIRHDIEEVFATEDRAAVRFVLRGRHTGSFFGIPATQQSVAVPGHVIVHIADGRVTKLLGIFDEAGMLRQLGVLG